MEIIFLLKGLLLGFSIAAPVGPIGILCIRRTLQYGRLSGLFTGLGAACADTLYGLLAAFSLTLVSDFLEEQRFYLHILGGCFLILLGAKTFCASTKEMASGNISHRSLISDFISTFFLTLSNPLTIFSFIAVFAGLGLVNISQKISDAVLLVTGIFLGACTWWTILSEGISFFRKKVGQKTMLWINRVAGIVIITFGLAALATSYHF
ncbi:MAG TPA: LysE family transporter [Chlamydiales bacterium]|nr:LysE family transporter [Chlamydiales bacterium]